MKNQFWRPFILLALAVLLLLGLAPALPAWENGVFSLKNLNWLGSLSEASEPGQVIGEVDRPTSAEGPLDGFRAELEELDRSKRGNLRIAYFGDSIIEGDLITGKLREQLQERCGGDGVGLVPITSIVNKFRATIGHDFSKNWQTFSFSNRGSYEVPLGIMGQVFIPRPWYSEQQVVEVGSTATLRDSLAADSTVAGKQIHRSKVTRRHPYGGPAWVEYRAVSHPAGSSSFGHIRLFYDHAPAGAQVRVSLDGGPFTSHNLEQREGVRQLDLSPSAPVKRVRLEFDPNRPVHVYGVSFDAPKGLYVDNLAVRGFTGVYFDAIPVQTLRSFHQLLDYDLVVLQYGLNVSNPKVLDYSDYRKLMLRTVHHVQLALPGVPILMVSAHDRSIRTKGVFKTSPDIPILVKTQAEVARESGCAFWNLYEAMGGRDSMPGYVKAGLANADYLHFTISGADRVGSLLCGFISGEAPVVR